MTVSIAMAPFCPTPSAVVESTLERAPRPILPQGPSASTPGNGFHLLSALISHPRSLPISVSRQVAEISFGPPSTRNTDGLRPLGNFSVWMHTQHTPGSVALALAGCSHHLLVNLGQRLRTQRMRTRFERDVSFQRSSSHGTLAAHAPKKTASSLNRVPTHSTRSRK